MRGRVSVGLRPELFCALAEFRKLNRLHDGGFCSQVGFFVPLSDHRCSVVDEGFMIYDNFPTKPLFPFDPERQ